MFDTTTQKVEDYDIVDRLWSTDCGAIRVHREHHNIMVRLLLACWGLPDGCCPCAIARAIRGLGIHSSTFRLDSVHAAMLMLQVLRAVLGLPAYTLACGPNMKMAKLTCDRPCCASASVIVYICPHLVVDVGQCSCTLL